MSAPVTPGTLTREMASEHRDSLRDGTPLTRDHAMFTACTNVLAAFKESAWNPGALSEPYVVAAIERVCDAINARRAKEQP